MKTIKSFALVAIAALSIVACGGNSNAEQASVNNEAAEKPVWEGKIKFSTESTHGKENPSVLIISSSSRRGGNTDLLADEFKRGAEEAGATVEKINLADLNIAYLNEEEANFEAKEARNDDATAVVAKMAEADVIVLAGPVYYMNIDGRMKTLIDRTFSMGHNQDIANKEYFYLTACTDEEDATAMCAVNAFRGFIMCVPGSVERGMVKAIGCARKDSKRLEPFKLEAYELGKGV